jgi:single-strand DNA-binding protein
MLNKVILVGRMCTDPELKYTPSGVAVANFRIAVDRPFKNAQGDKETDFIDVVAWRHTADFVNTYIKKGQLMFVEGVLQVRQWQTPDGQKRRQAEVVAENLRPLDRPREREEGASVGTSTAGHYTPRPQQQSTGGNGNGFSQNQSPRDNYSMPEDVQEYSMPDISDPFDDQ